MGRILGTRVVIQRLAAHEPFADAGLVFQGRRRQLLTEGYSLRNLLKKLRQSRIVT